MATGRTTEVIQCLLGGVLRRHAAELTDGQLLEWFQNQRDDTAFAVLVRRHGPMVWGVCRRLLRNHHDAEDAFQATFLVLVRKAASLASRELLANWLYGVAHNTARKAKVKTARRRDRERQVLEMPEPEAVQQGLGNDLQPLLDQELSRLPDKYRILIVLCDLEGKTRRDVAGQLGCPEGTVAGRLARARRMLAKRFARHGLAVSGGVLATMLSQPVASAGVPTSVVSSTIQAASLFAAGQAAAVGVISVEVAALTEGVLKTMLLTKLKTATAVVLLLAALACFGAGVLRHTATAADQPKAAQKEGPTNKKPDEAGKPTLTFHVRLFAVEDDRDTIDVFCTLEKPGQNLADVPKDIQERFLGATVAPTRLSELRLAKDAKFDGKGFRVTDLKVGMQLTLEVATDEAGLIVVGISTGKKGGEKKSEKTP